MTSSEPREINLDEIKGILESGDFKDFIDVRENSHFEAKQKKPYDFSNTPQFVSVSKLATDIGSIANNDEAFIICGLTTTKPLNSSHDIVSGLELFPESEFYTDTQIQGIIKSSIFPKLKVELTWYPSKDDKSLGLGVIFIPKQEEEKKYFIVSVCEADGQQFKGFVGIPVRNDDTLRWFKPQEVYEQMRKLPTSHQVMFQTISNQLEQISEKISVMDTSTPLMPDILQERIEEALDEQ